MDPKPSLLECSHNLVAPEKQLLDATGGAVVQADGNWIPIICGGRDRKSDKVQNLCYTLTKDSKISSHGKVVSGFLRVPREGAASVSVDNGQRLWVTGGNDWVTTMGTELVQVVDSGIVTNMTWRMPTGHLRHHCLVIVDQTVALVIGGQDQENTLQRQSWSIRLDEIAWHWKPELMTVNRTKHACGVVADLTTPWRSIVIAAGGLIPDFSLNADSEIEVTASTNMMAINVEADEKLETTYWKHGPLMPERVGEASAVTTPDNSRLLLMGGYKANGDYNLLLFSIQCQDLQCDWEVKSDVELRLPIASGVAILVPPTSMRTVGGFDQYCNYFSRSRETNLIILVGGDQLLSENKTGVISILPNGELLPCPSDDLSLSTNVMFGGQLVTTETEDNVDKSYRTSFVCGYPQETTGWGFDFADYIFCQALGSAYRFPHKLKNKWYTSAATLVRFKSVTIHNGTAIWLTGTYFKFPYIPDYTKLFTIHTTASHDSQLGPMTISVADYWKLPRLLNHHCPTLLPNTDTVILSGGQEENFWGSKVTVHQSWAIDLEQNFIFIENVSPTWKELDSLKQVRARHMCGILTVGSTTTTTTTTVVVAAGGWLEEENVAIDSVELLTIHQSNDTQTGHWQDGPKLPNPLFEAGTASTADNTRLFVAGGFVNDFNTLTNAILSLQCLTITICKWSKPEMVLDNAMSNILVMTLPPYETYPLCT